MSCSFKTAAQFVRIPAGELGHVGFEKREPALLGEGRGETDLLGLERRDVLGDRRVQSVVVVLGGFFETFAFNRLRRETRGHGHVGAVGFQRIDLIDPHGFGACGEGHVGEGPCVPNALAIAPGEGFYRGQDVVLLVLQEAAGALCRAKLGGIGAACGVRRIGKLVETIDGVRDAHRAGGSTR